MTVVFVCSGNTCRSPMAQVLLADLLAKRGVSARVLSAGTGAFDGDGAAPHAVEVMAEYGLSLEDHRSTRLSDRLVAEADVLLTMTAAHKEFIVRRFPDAAEKTFLLKQFAGYDGDVGDPFGSDKAAYEKTAAELARLLETVADRLLAERAPGGNGP